jgi:putative endonuclease
MIDIIETWFVYLLKCSDETLYCGMTNNLTRRIIKHNESKGAKYTKGRGPVTLIKFWTFPTKGEALSFEYKVKQLPRDDKLKL